jgi:hypothetical protein
VGLGELFLNRDKYCFASRFVEAEFRRLRKNSYRGEISMVSYGFFVTELHTILPGQAASLWHGARARCFERYSKTRQSGGRAHKVTGPGISMLNHWGERYGASKRSASWRTDVSGLGSDINLC